MMVSTNVRLLRPLGEGGMGAVWVAEHQSLRTQVVVKFMSGDLLKSPEATARFSREAAAASQVKSPHVVQTFDHGITSEGTPYIVMELLEGRDLEHHLRAGGPMAPREVVAVVAQLARALSKAHERSIVHRDIKPSNVFLCDAGGGEMFVKLLDFGIAKGPEVAIVGSTTRTGSFIGSPYYMSPEQVVGAKDIDHRSDLWSTAVVAFEALTGERPFYAETVGALALKIHRDPLPKPTTFNSKLPVALDQWFEHACAREPEKRYQSAKEMADALAVAVTGEAMPAGVNIDRMPAPHRTAAALAATEQATLPDHMPSASDARSETGAGVGLASQRIPVNNRGRLLLLGGVALAAVSVGFLLPRLISHPADPPTAASATSAAAAASTSLAAAIPSAVTLPPLPSATSLPVDTASAAASSHPTAPIPAAPPGVGKAKPHASATASAPAVASPPPAPTPTVVKPPAGSDDDIK
jgi:serine/threonine-protein kinase